MTPEEAYRLNELQYAFESDSQNAQKAYEYFQELNKHQFYLSVVKEYEKYEEKVEVTEKNLGGWAPKMTS